MKIGKQTAAPMNIVIGREDLIANTDRMNLITEQLNRLLSALAVQNHALRQIARLLNGSTSQSDIHTSHDSTTK